MKKKLIIGNWKMNPVSLEDAKKIFNKTKSTLLKLRKLNVVICPPFVYVSDLAKIKTPKFLSVGAQDIYTEEQGSFTGEISPLMLKDLGVTHVIVGHSEKRERGDTDEIVSKKIKLLLEANINPVLCVGEVKRDNSGEYLDILKNQIKSSLEGVSKKFIGKVVMAYEPIWAIGANASMEPSIIYEMSIFIKKVLSDIYGQDEAMKISILYGGSVNFRNAPDIIEKGQVDGLLIGRESVNIDGFKELLKSVNTL